MKSRVEQLGIDINEDNLISDLEPVFKKHKIPLKWLESFTYGHFVDALILTKIETDSPNTKAKYRTLIEQKFNELNHHPNIVHLTPNQVRWFFLYCILTFVNNQKFTEYQAAMFDELTTNLVEWYDWEQPPDNSGKYLVDKGAIEKAMKAFCKTLKVDPEDIGIV